MSIVKEKTRKRLQTNVHSGENKQLQTCVHSRNKKREREKTKRLVDSNHSHVLPENK
jgi:hypothetical protein